MNSPTSREIPDIRDRNDLAEVVHAFYRRVREDGQLGPIFDTSAGVDWDAHLPKMIAFWEKALFREGSYRGNPLRTHLELNQKVALTASLFERWITLFDATVDSLYQGQRAGHLKRIAADMAQVMQSRISGEPINFSSPEYKRGDHSDSAAGSQ